MARCRLKTSGSAMEEATDGMIIEGYGMSETLPLSPLADNRYHGALWVSFSPRPMSVWSTFEDPSIDVEDGIPSLKAQVFSAVATLMRLKKTARVLLTEDWMATYYDAVINK